MVDVDDKVAPHCGLSVYFGSEFTSWWRHMEIQNFLGWIASCTGGNGNIRLFSKPQDGVTQRDNRTGAVSVEIRSRLKKLIARSRTATETGTPVMTLVPLYEDIVNLEKYIERLVPVFCEEMFKVGKNKNGHTTVLCVLHVEDLSAESLVEVVDELYLKLNKYRDTQIFTAFAPTRGPVSCLSVKVEK